MNYHRARVPTERQFRLLDILATPAASSIEIGLNFENCSDFLSFRLHPEAQRVPRGFDRLFQAKDRLLD